jgi:hypothetical protein
MNPLFRLLLIITVALLLAFTGPVQAQTQEDATAETTTTAADSADDQAATDSVNNEAGPLEEIIVTGSRLRRDSFNVSTPLVMMDTEAIQDTGLD